MDVVAPHGCCLPHDLWAQIIASKAGQRDPFG
jgi:hypothetical protein